MGRAKKGSERQCLRCMLCGKLCHSGTLKGACVACGSISLTDNVTPFDKFFNNELGDHLLSLARAGGYAPLKSDQDVLQIDTTTPNGLPNSHRVESRNKFRSSLDKMVWVHYTPKVRCRTSTTNLITNALFGRGYLSILFPSKVVNEAETFTDRLRLLNISLERLDESITKVVDGFNKKVPDNDRYWSEVSASLAILYFGLQHAQEGLKDCSIKPIWGGTKLAGLLAQRIELTLKHFTLLLHHRSISCDIEWASILDSSIEDLRSNVTIFSLSARMVKQAGQMSTRSLSTTSSVSTSFSATSTSLSSIDSRTSEDPGSGNPETSVRSGWLDTGPRPLSTPTKLSSSVVVQLEDSDLFNLIPPAPTNSVKQSNLLSSLPAFPYGNISNISEHPPIPASYTSPGSGFSNLMSPEPLPNLQVLGMFYDNPSEIEQIPYHVSGPLSYDYDTREETSVLASRDLFPDLQFYLRPSAEEGKLAADWFDL